MKLNTKSLADVEVGTPLIAEGIYFVRIRPEIKVEPNKDKTGQVLKLTLQVLDDEVRTYEDDKVVNNENHRMTLWHNVSLTETYNEDGSVRYDPLVRLKELGLAVGLPEDFEDIDTSDLQGKCMKVQIKHRPAEKGYSARNEISRVLPIGESDGFTEPAFN